MGEAWRRPWLCSLSMMYWARFALWEPGFLISRLEVETAPCSAWLSGFRELRHTECLLSLGSPS